MKQLLFVSATSGAGSLEAIDLTDYSVLSGKPEHNFSLAIKGDDKVNDFLIPEVDLKTLTVTKAEYAAGTDFKAEVDLSDVEVTEGSNYSLILAKLGAVFNERTQWSATDFVPFRNPKNLDATKIAGHLADTLGGMANKYIKDGVEKFGTGAVLVNVTLDGAKITIEGTDDKQKFTLKAADDLYGLVEVDETPANPTILDAAFVKDLASRCAAGKGFFYPYADGETIYPGYPENIPEGKYVMYTLRFAVGRDFGTTRDERAIQLVHVVSTEDVAVLEPLVNKRAATTNGAADANGSGTTNLDTSRLKL